MKAFFMKKKVQFIFIIAAVMLGLCGCALPTYTWVKPGGTQQAFAQDRYTCLQSSQQRVAGTRQQAWSGQQEAYNEVQVNDQMFVACMNAKGWTQQRQNK